MSIETEISELVAAVKELTAAINTSNKLVGNAAPAVVKEEPAKKEVKKAASSSTKDAATTDVHAQATAETSAAPASKESTSGEEASEIDFVTQIQKPIVAMAAGGKRDQALAILRKFGAHKASEIKPEDYAEAVKLIAEA